MLAVRPIAHVFRPVSLMLSQQEIKNVLEQTGIP